MLFDSIPINLAGLRLKTMTTSTADEALGYASAMPATSAPVGARSTLNFTSFREFGTLSAVRTFAVRSSTS
jgi:hypothetical protein